MNESDLRGVKALVNDIETKIAIAKGLINQAIEWTEFKSKEEAASDLGFDSWGKLDEDRATYEFEGGVLVADY